MNRPAFLTSPGAWLHTRRHAQTQADYACAVQRPVPTANRIAGVFLAVVIGVLFTLLLVHHLAK
jgi:hypothetical protein